MCPGNRGTRYSGTPLSYKALFLVPSPKNMSSLLFPLSFHLHLFLLRLFLLYLVLSFLFALRSFPSLFICVHLSLLTPFLLPLFLCMVYFDFVSLVSPLFSFLLLLPCPSLIPPCPSPSVRLSSCTCTLPYPSSMLSSPPSPLPSPSIPIYSWQHPRERSLPPPPPQPISTPPPFHS